ncbi:hypothetical protein MalM25_24960 [Planctomycetes bacterium MalM25]|nr:hypothetical protein MalM25_24960 [Planctomycetes bacterium MalM25]
MTVKATIRLFALCLIASIAGPASAEAPSWWPGGGESKGTDSSAATAAADGESAMVDSPLFKIGWPKVEMPKLSWKPGFGGGDKAATPGQPGGNPISRALDKVATGSKDASDKVRNAWGSAMSSLPFGGDDTARTAKNDSPGFWSRLMTPAKEPEGSQTVQGFLAQERVGTRR